MRVLIAPDSFTGTLSATEAAGAIAAGWRRARPEDDVDLLPLSDGGPGFVEVLHTALGGELVPCPVTGPLGAPVAASVLVVGETAYLESAQACGLHLVSSDRRDPSATTSRGVGELVAAAAPLARRVVVGLGGSGTNDGGAGLLQALGWSLRDADGMEIPGGGLALEDLREVRPVPAPAVEIVAATDVDNPLLGPAGASYVFGPQKGATVEQVGRLDAALRHWADLAEPAVAAAGTRGLPGAGAAGGLGFALLLLGGRRDSGIELVLEASGLRARAADADLVLTGEGSFDPQSLRGKVVAGVAGATATPCVVLAGRVSVDAVSAADAGVTAAYDTRLVDANGATPAGERLARLAALVAGRWTDAPPP
ncbi:MAG TPA: glycerate kinase [Mycobacteriales bacterium]|nr:glycerate kinase [Mycobacteriales bacterium]